MNRGEVSYHSVTVSRHWPNVCVRRYVSHLETVRSFSGWRKISSPIKLGLGGKNDAWRTFLAASPQTFRLSVSLCFRRFPPTSVAWFHCINTCAEQPNLNRHAGRRNPQRNTNSLFLQR